MEMHKVVLSLGGNVGDVLKTFMGVEKELSSSVGRISKSSRTYQTEAWGKKDQSNFLNKVLLIETLLEPDEMMKTCLDIERKMGRNRNNSVKWAERMIDVDILFYDDLVVREKDLIIPHPHLHERNFVMIPLNEIFSDYVHPLLKRTVKELRFSCLDISKVVEYEQ